MPAVRLTAAVVLATRHRRHGLAAICLAILAVFDILGAIAFGVAEAIHGF